MKEIRGKAVILYGRDRKETCNKVIRAIESNLTCESDRRKERKTKDERTKRTRQARKGGGEGGACN